MDIVYVFKPSKNKSIELRYSLIFLANIPHNKVYLIWDIPPFVKNVIHIPFKDTEDKITNVRKKYEIIAEHKDISDDFILMYDDVMSINPITSFKPYINWSIKDAVKKVEDKFWHNRYWLSLKWVYELFPDWINYETHTPGIYNKEKFKYIIENYHNKWANKSIYYNYYKIEWQELPNWWDCKVYNNEHITKSMLKYPYISTYDWVCWNERLWKILKTKLQEIPKFKKSMYLEY